ncbi:MAG: hypothetical protein ACYTFW_20435 [Planctomycetota bacterium]|jgi:hypothetical protein
MRLSVPERLKLLELLPEKESYEGMMEVQRLGMTLSITGEEAEQIDVKPAEGGGIMWNQEKALGLIVDVPMGEFITNVIRVILREKSRERELEVTELTLYEKFIMDYE